MNTIKFAVVGCGRISKNHLEAIKAIPEAELLAVCDIEFDRAAAAASTYGCQAYMDIPSMLQQTKPDVVAICTPSGLHPTHGILAAQAGCHVICEKPMGLTLESADNLITACKVHNRHLFVVKQNRLNPTMQLLKKAVDKGRFGKLYLAQANVLWNRPQSYYDQAAWRGTWALDGGAFMNQASHYVDSLQWLLGDPRYVVAATNTLGRSIEAEDTGSAVIEFKNGAIGSITVTMLTYPKNLEGSITLIGEKGTVKVGGFALNKFEHWDFQDYDDDDKYVQDCCYTPPNVYGFGHAAYYQNVMDVLQNKAAPDTDGLAGRKSLEIILGIYLAADSGTAITFPL